MHESKQMGRALRGIGTALALLLTVAGCRQAEGRELRYTVTGGNPDRGRQAIQIYGCGSCHTIPGIDQANGTVGPPLYFWARRTYIAGEVPNTPDFLIRWIQVPQAIEPGTAMPNLGVTEQHARDIAAYLYTIH